MGESVIRNSSFFSLLKRRLKVFAKNVFVGSTYLRYYLTSSYRKSIVFIF